MTTPPPDTKATSDRDIVVEAREHIQARGSRMEFTTRKQLETLADEVERLRARLSDPCLVAGYHVCGGVHKAGDPWKG